MKLADLKQVECWKKEENKKSNQLAGRQTLKFHMSSTSQEKSNQVYIMPWILAMANTL